MESTLITPSEPPKAARGPSTTPDRGRNATLEPRKSRYNDYRD
jgi:hypothetical protein